MSNPKLHHRRAQLSGSGQRSTDSLSVLRIETDGSRTIVDHLLDTRDTRFGDVTALEIVSYRDQTFLTVGDGDDGITVLQMVPSGQLVTRAVIADNQNTTLPNVIAITDRNNGDVLDILVSSNFENGLIRLACNIGPQGLDLTSTSSGGTLQGSNGSDIITGLNGNDLLYGHADDIMTGGTDVYHLCYGRQSKHRQNY
jgi:Ca2+-binding RTX toxin-like protein